jgi:undecaprenyl diphosphate synthase
VQRLDASKIPRHVAIIPDGNGRWAESRGLPRNFGHKQGTETVRGVVRAAHELGIERLTVYAFSTENWARPPEEVDAIMDLLDRYLASETDYLVKNGIRVEVIGSTGMLDSRIQERLAEIVRRTESNDEMRLYFALSYSGRSEIVDAVRAIAREVEAGAIEPEAIDEKCLQAHLYAPELPDPDLLIRTGGEHRVSNFLLWQLAYTELWTCETLWPDFTKRDLVDALLAYQQRERRFGRTGSQAREGAS